MGNVLPLFQQIRSHLAPLSSNWLLLIQSQPCLIAAVTKQLKLFVFLQIVTDCYTIMLWFKGRTTVIVAHRLSTVRNADKIIVIESGKAVEEGSHDELLGIDGGKYNNLIKIQLSQTDDGENDVNKEIEDDVKKTIQKRNTKPRFRKQSKNVVAIL